ncbi:lactadherin-like, partial [Anneissia japonica]|uniref:lactadherin-like n=1 Tax=Anneissia japonica TaxID=1529436 RepID=UPI001425AD26
MEDGTIPDENLDASNDAHETRYARLNQESPKRGWKPRDHPGEWIEADLSVVKTITGVTTQGCYDENKWVEVYEVQYSTDGQEFANAVGPEGNIFVGNIDAETHVINLFTNPVLAQFIRIVVVEWNNDICLRFEVLGCTVPTTAAHTTLAPTTEAPTTEAPTTEAPTTEALTTETLTTVPLAIEQLTPEPAG